MEKRYQVFISSTYTDLIDERREVMQALLEMDCLPAGMEMFPAADDGQWTLIKSVIDQSDYYLVIVGGRYGSLTAEGISYTEKEYDYAVASNIPVLGFVHANPDGLPRDKSSLDPGVWEKLVAFREKVMTRMVKTYGTPSELGSVVSRSLMRTIRTTPREGWVRGRDAMSPDTRAEIAELRAQLSDMQRVEAEAGLSAPPDDSLAQGDDRIELGFTYGSGHWSQTQSWVGTWEVSWDEALRTLGPMMADEATEGALKGRLETFVLSAALEDTEYGLERVQEPELEIDVADWEKVMVQLRALGYVRTGTKRRTVSDRATYWTLTESGDERLVELLALRRTPKVEALEGSN